MEVRSGLMQRRVFRIVVWLFFMKSAFLSRASAADFIGPSKCTGCHDHQRQTAKWKVEEPRNFGKKAHFNALKRLDEPNASRYAAALGLGDPFDVRGSRTCVRCHATVYKGEANVGVSCESCHGAASGYVDIHQQTGAYRRAVGAGMRDLREKPQTIAIRCAECHAVKDAELIAAGHPSGDGFNGGDQLRKIVHWNTSYDFSQVASAYAAVAGRGRPTAATLAATPLRATPGPPASTRTPLGTSATPRGSGELATRGPAETDWFNRPVKPLPRGYVPPPPRVTRVEPPPPRSFSSPQPVRTSATLFTRNVDPPVVNETEADPPEPSPAPSPPSAPINTPGAALRAEALMLLDKLLRGGARLPSLKPPAAPQEYSGPDGELYRIQDEALALIMEALRSAEPERVSRK